MRTSITLLDVCLGVVGVYLVKRLLEPKPKGVLPPGPRKLPLLENTLDLPATYEWLTFSKWGQLYGDICSITGLGKTFIIINNAQMAIDLLDKRSSNYSDRPVLEMGGTLSGYQDTLVLLRYTDRFRRTRKMFHRVIGSPSHVKQFYDIEEKHTHQFLRNILDKPEELSNYVRHNAGAIILKIAYDYDVEPHDDPLVDLVDRALAQFSKATAPGAFMVDFIPALKHLPDWFPGAGFKRTAKFYRETLMDMVDRPYNMVKERVAAGTARLSFITALLDDPDLDDEKVHEIKWAAASLYGGGADTTVSSIYSFFLAMMLHPEVQRKAQEEIDLVVGTDRLPSLEDLPNLPYTEGLAKEVLRWNCVAPIGAPHRVVEDDFFEGYFIPKDSLVIVNIWGLQNDPRLYPEPRKFDPTRFLGPSPQLDPREICFGFGRRVCPGQHLADASVFISCAMSLAVFNISKAVVNGVVDEPVLENTPGTISHPKPFKCSIKPRSEQAIALIRSEHL